MSVESMMKHIASVVVLVGAGAALSGPAFGQGTEIHEGKIDAEKMKKLHAVMPMYAEAQAKIRTALTKRDAAAVKAETDRILATTPDLKFGKPHRNLQELKKFRDIALAFEAEVEETAIHASEGDFAAAQAAFAKAEGLCVKCHSKFKD